MERRELLKLIAVLTGGVVIGSEVFLTGCTSGPKTEAGFSAANISMLDEVGETIIPTTNTPGAKATKIGEFMRIIVTDCYTESEQEAFTKGLKQLEEASEKTYDRSFVSITPEERHKLLLTLEAEARDFNKKRDDDDKLKREQAKSDKKKFVGSPSHYYTMMKQLTLWGYFSSEIGAKQALRYLPIPGKYDGNYAYAKGDRAWHE
jgi:hypothetical protein